MNKRSLYILLFVSFFLGCFFQYSRLDGFLHLGLVGNELSTERSERPMPPEGNLPREKFLIVYDPADVASMYARHNTEKLLTEKRKDYESRTIYDVRPLDGAYQGVALATGRLDAVKMLPALLDYVRSGGTLLVLQKIEQESDAPLAAELLQDFGIKSLGGESDVLGVHLVSDFLIGGKDFRFGEGSVYTTHANGVALTGNAKVHIEALDGTPLLWESALGNGRIYAYNGVERDDKTNVGILTAMLAHCGEDSLYPVVGVKIFFIDDFPAPIPEGYFYKIYDELGVDKAEAEKKEKEFKPIVEKIKEALGDKVKEVKLSKRLSDSPSCIVVDENDPSFQMERMMKAMGQTGVDVKPILEVNGDHPIVQKLKDTDDKERIADISFVLLDQALLVGGEELKDPADFVKRMNNLLSK